MTLLEPGMEAPDFELVDQDGKTWKLSDLRGQKVVVYFYPADDTPGCTAEACDFRDTHQDWKRAGYVVLGISPQDARSKRRFADKYTLNFPLLADVGGEVAARYGTYGEKKLWNTVTVGTKRSTFVIDEEGRISEAMYGVRAKGHVDTLKQKLLTA